MLNITRVFVMIAVALLAGSYFSGAYVIVPAQRHLSASAYVEVEQANTRLGTIRFRVLVFATMLLQIALIIQLRSATGMEFLLTVSGFLLVVAATVITVRWVVPINATIHSWNFLTPPEDWQTLRQKWAGYHLARTVLVCIALLAQALAYVPQQAHYK
jgi:hypothetical protein